MEVVEANPGVQKSSTAIAESSQEEEKNIDNGTTTTTTTTKTITKTTKQQNGSSNNDDDNNNIDNDETIITKVNIKKDLPKKVVKINDEVVKIEDVPNDDDETEIIEIIEGDESGEDVEIVETVVIKKSPQTLDDNDKLSSSEQTTTTTKTITTNKKLINKQNSNDSSTDNNQNTEVTIKLNKTKSENESFDKETTPISKPPIKIDKKLEPAAVTNQEEEPIKKVEIELKPSKELTEEIKEVAAPAAAEEEEEEEEVIEEEEEEEEEEEVVEEEPIAEKIIIAQKPPLPTSVTHQQSLEEPLISQQHKEDKPIVQQKQQHYQMQQPQVGQHDKQQKNENTIFYGRSPPSSTEIKQENIKNQLKEIISDIDRVIEQEEDKPTTSSIPQQQYQQQLPQQQQQQHQVSTTTTREESHDDGYSRKVERIERNEIQGHDDGSTQFRSTTTSTTVKATPQSQQQQQHYMPPSGQNLYHYGPPPSSIKSYDQLKGHRSMSLPSPYAVEQSSTSSTTKTVDLQKIFTPATDYEEILPKNRILYSSSAFYSPNLHPTVEDQVELARRISHSLSDISNQQSKGQSMYVNRKKRSVKWVHEGEGKAQVQDYSGYHHGYEGHKENEYEHTSYHDKVPLKLVMNPRGQVRDFTSIRQDFNQETSGLLSPDKCAELVAGLNAPKGKGAELFAKRRKKSEKWIVDETNAAQQSPSGVQPYGTVSPNILPAYSDVGVQRVQLNMHQDQVQDKYAQPRIKMIKTPWEAALETGSASAAFQELPNLKQPASFVPQQSTGYDYSNYTPITYQQQQPSQQQQQQQQHQQQKYHQTQEYQQFSQTQQQQKSWQPNSQRDLAYKPSIPQGWNAPPTTLPKELYVPKEIPLDGYIPPATEKYLPSNPSAYSSLPSASSSLYNPQVPYQSNDYSSTYQQQQQMSSSVASTDVGGGGGGGSGGHGGYGGIGLSTSPIPKQFPLSQQYSSTLTTSYLDGGSGGMSTLAPRSTSPYYQTPTVSGGVAATASTFNNYNTTSTFPVSQKPANYYSAPPINKPINNWRTQPHLGNHPSPVAFNPSPLPYEKLAKFQQPEPYENVNNFRVPIPGIRRPLAVPNSGGNKVRNLSPVPYYSSSPAAGGVGGSVIQPSKSFSSSQQLTTTKTTTHYQTTQHDKQQFSNQYFNDSSKYSSSYGTGGGCGTADTIGPTSTSTKLTSADLSHCHNYNTAARGWGQAKNCYKPITFTKSPIAADMPYTDF